eukprot:GFUD01021174.1.p1 GENE.GFUD01021174.1~~GFUD01021174.1.p1  ORF type:complete len:722 (+),score=149.03 GFUD01021174.1:268-2433(+)
MTVKAKEPKPSAEVGEVGVIPLPDSKSAGTWWLVFGACVLMTMWTRLHKVSQPAWVCWDETHFGKMASWYINRTFFFDVHPPLGKMLIAGMGYTTGYNGTHPFEKPGDPYDDHSYLGMRVGCTLLGCAIVPFSFLTVWQFTHSLTAASLAAAFLIFDIGVLVLNRYILLDPILLFFISGSVFAMAQFRGIQEPFTVAWWSWLTVTGAMLAGAISVKFVGLFVVLYVGIFTIGQLWYILGDVSKPFLYTLKHFIARAICLIMVPIALYITFFYIHLTILSKSGSGDGFYSSLFQSTLEGNRLYNASMPKEVAYGALVTLKNHRTGGGYLHSHFHLYPEGVGSKQQQVTTYAHKDENNFFVMKKWNEEPPNNTDIDAVVDLVKNGDLVRLEHLQSKRNIHSHNQPAPVSKRHFQVTGYGENGTGDANDVWRLEVIGGKEGEVVNTVTSKLKFHHYFVKCVLTCSTKNLPKWGFEQGEVSCNPTTRDPNAMWNVEDNLFSKLPNSSVHDLAPSFFSRFIESHKVMLQGNSGLKPKEGEMTSKPWEWPINLRGQWFSAGDDKTRIYLLGNPVIWWANIVFLIIFLIIYSYSSLKSQRGVLESPEITAERENTMLAASWLFLGWSLHYIPFWTMGRVLYVHHYYPALLFSSMLSAVLLDYIIVVISRMLPSSLSSTLTHTAMGLVLGGCWYTFYLFSPLVYGMGGEYARESNSSMHHLHWMETWEF